MSKKDEALKLAEDALKRVRTQDMELVQLSMIALAAIREALAERPAVSAGPITPAMMQGPTPEQKSQMVAAMSKLAEQPAPATELREQEPVAYAVYHRMGGSKSLHWPEQHSPDGDANEYQLLPLYTSPPPQRTWVGLTDEDWKQIFLTTNATTLPRAIEAKLREKNQ